MQLGHSVRSSRACPLCEGEKTRGALICRSCYDKRRGRRRRCRRPAGKVRNRAELKAAARLQERGLSWRAAVAIAKLAEAEREAQNAAEGSERA